MQVLTDKTDTYISTLPPITSTFIVCGDCAGEGDLPIKTLMRQDGHCATCGGGSFALAADLAARKRALEYLRAKGVIS